MATVEDFERCRALRHAWNVLEAAEGDTYDGHVHELRLQCTSCTTRRADTFNKHGDLVAREYTYPTGYRLHGEEKPLLTELRMKLVARAPKGTLENTEEGQ
jgi:hypothetical protein